MQNRFLLFLFACAFLAAGTIFAQPAAPGATVAMEAGAVIVATVSGDVKVLEEGKPERSLVVDDRVFEKGKIRTGSDGVVVLAFSNGATTRLGNNTELILETFQQVPIPSQIRVKDLTEEPTPSRTRLRLNRGELVGDVKKLKDNSGNGFVVETPVGAAGIRGTVFRIVFIPQGTGYAFTLTTVSGNVQFGGLPSSTGGTTPTVTATGTVKGLEVPTGQAITFVDVEVTTNAQGQTVATVLPPPPASPSPATNMTMQQTAVLASEIALAVQNAVFTPTPPSSGGGTSNSSPGSGGTTGSTTGSTTGGTTGTGGSGTTGQTGGGQTTTVTGTSTTGGNFTATVTNPPPTPPPPLPPIPPIPRVTSP